MAEVSAHQPYKIGCLVRFVKISETPSKVAMRTTYNNFVSDVIRYEPHGNEKIRPFLKRENVPVKDSQFAYA